MTTSRRTTDANVATAPRPVNELLRTVIEHQRDHSWKIRIHGSITDQQALEITWRATPDQVLLGAYVEVEDDGGIRIGHVAAASYHERLVGPAYVKVELDLR